MLLRYRTIPSLLSDIDTIFDTAFPVRRTPSYTNAPSALSMKDAGDSLTVTLALPGIAKEDVKVTLHDGLLTVVAERRAPELKEKERWLRNEIGYGRTERSVALPYPVVTEKVSALHENGLLRIVLPKAEEAKPKQIAIR